MAVFGTRGLSGFLSDVWRAVVPGPPLEEGYHGWSDAVTRRRRYAVLWGFYDGTIYQGRYADTLRREFRLYRHVRGVFNDCGRIVDFHASHTYPGDLDPAAGDGTGRHSAAPVELGPGADPACRAAVATTMAASNAQGKLNLMVRWGAALGDVALEVVPDPNRGVVRFRVLNPAEIESATLDAYGNVRSYAAERWELDPEDPRGLRRVQYREEVSNENGVVTYRTFKDMRPYRWPGTPGARWEGRWGFVPLVLVQHVDQGDPWGTSELQNALQKTIERDDQGSNLGDQARKATNGPWFLAGAGLGAPAAPAPRSPYDGADPYYSGVGARHRPGAPALQVHVESREGVPFITCPSQGATVTSLTAPLPIEAVSGHIRSISDSHEEDYPELVADKVVVSGYAASGAAIEKARAKAADKIMARRRQYDGALARVLKMALTMGGDLGYPGYEGLGAGAYEAGRLDLRVGPRPVYTPTPGEVIAENAARAQAAKTYFDMGVPLGTALRLTGMPPEQVARVVSDVEAARLAAAASGAEPGTPAVPAVVPSEPAGAVPGGDPESAPYRAADRTETRVDPSPPGAPGTSLGLAWGA